LLFTHLVEISLALSQRSEKSKSGENVGFADLLCCRISQRFDDLLDEERRRAEEGRDRSDEETSVSV